MEAGQFIDCDDFVVGCHDFGLLRIRQLYNFKHADIVIIYLSTEKMDDDSSSGSHISRAGREQGGPQPHITPIPNVPNSDSFGLKIDDDSSSGSPSYLNPFFSPRQGAGLDLSICHKSRGGLLTLS